MIVRFEGADKLNAKLKQMVSRCPTECARFMRMESELVKGRIKHLTPVDTGRLRNAWSSTVSGNSATIFNNVYYSPFVEFRAPRKNSRQVHGRSRPRRAHAP